MLMCKTLLFTAAKIRDMHVQWSSCYLSYAWVRAIHVSVNQNHNALTTGASGEGTLCLPALPR